MTRPAPVLEGHGVRLTPLALEHASALAGTQDAETWRYMSESGASATLLRGFIQRALDASAAGTCQAWASAVLDEQGVPQISGCTRLADLNWQHRTGEIGWTWVAPSYRGSGLNVRIKLLQLRYAFQTLHLRRVALKTHHANLASQKAITKLGAKFEGTFRNHIIMPDGSSRDTCWYSIIDSDWPVVEEHLLCRIAAEPLLKRAAAGSS